MADARRRIWFIGALILSISCTHTGNTPRSVEPVPVPSNAPATSGMPVDPALRPLVDVAIDDLARRLGVTRDLIIVLEARPVVWPDGGLGCPRPGMAYPQVQQEGLLIRLRARERDYSYHGGGGRPPFLCETP